MATATVATGEPVASRPAGGTQGTDAEAQRPAAERATREEGPRAPGPVPTVDAPLAGANGEAAQSVATRTTDQTAEPAMGDQVAVPWVQQGPGRHAVGAAG